MNPLEQWIEGWLTCPVKDLNVLYWKTRKPFPEVERDMMAPRLNASEELLLQLYRRTKGRRAEQKIWTCLLYNIAHPLPDTIANDLIDRDICVMDLAHSPNNEAVLKRLVPLVDEALLTYAKVRYYDSKHSAEEFAEIISEYPTHDWLFESLAHSEPSSPEKHAIFLEWARKHPNSERILWTEEAMREGRIRWEKEQQERENQIATALGTTEEQKIRELLEAGDTELLFCLLKNSNTPDDVLVSITQLRNFTNAGVLRGQAKNVLDNRQKLKLKQSKP